MSAPSLQTYLFVVLAIVSASAASQQPKPFLKEFAVVAIEAVHYELRDSARGVPLLGLITGAAGEARVKFTTCSNTTLEVERAKLTTSPARCRKREDQGPFTAGSNFLLPVYKAESGSFPEVLIGGRRVNLEGPPLSTESRIALLSAKAGDLVGYAFTSAEGQKTIGLLKGK